MVRLKPLSKSAKFPLVQAFRGTSLTLSAADALLSGAEVLSEGRVEGEPGTRSYSGSTLLTINLDRRFDLGEGDHLDTLLACVRRSLRMHIGVLRLARQEAERKCAPYLIREMNAETSFRREKRRLLIDIDVECPVVAVNELEGEG
jgi:hypothetical protein